jgi:hypothetical protein
MKSGGYTYCNIADYRENITLGHPIDYTLRGMAGHVDGFRHHLPRPGKSVQSFSAENYCRRFNGRGNDFHPGGTARNLDTPS